MAIFHQTDVRVRQNQVVGRRDFLKGVSLAGAAAGTLGGLAAGGGLTDVMAAGSESLRKAGKACILVWLQGAPSQFETFDPKPDHDNGGETKAIDTSVAGIRIAENLPHIAKVADRLSIIRSLSTKEGNHQRATYMLHTSYVPTATVKHPTLGSVVSHEIVEPSCELPSFVRINGRGFGNGGGGGLLGTAYDPFDVGGAGRGPAGGPDGGGSLRPNNTAPTTPEDRYRMRLGLLGRLEKAADNPAIARASADHQKLYDKASRMILSPQMKAFDTAGEPEKIREAYGSGAFATGCLLARRLVETGVTCVEVGLGNWDTHDDNFNRCRTLCGQLDQPLAALVRDLEERGLLERTLVVVMGEFGRTPRINPRGGRDHYPRAFSAALAGCGVRGGQVIGRTDAGGDDVADGRMTEKDLFRSIYRALGIDADKEFMSPIGRPIKIVEGGAAVDSLFG